MKLDISLTPSNILLFVVIVVLSGCVTPGAPDLLDESRSSLGSITVSVGEFAPRGITARDINQDKSSVSGGIVGAAPGAAGMAAIAPMCANPYTAGVCAVFMPIFGIMAAAGGGAGVAYEESAGNIEAQAQRALARAIQGDAAQNSLVRQVAEYGKAITNRSISASLREGPNEHYSDALLEVALLKAEGIEVQGGFWGIESTHYAVSLEARARLKRRLDGVIIADRTYRYISVPRTPQEWSSDQGILLINEIDNGYRQLGEWIIDDFVLSLNKPQKPLVAAKAEESDFLGNVANPKPEEFTLPVMPLPIEPHVNFCKPVVISGIPFPPIQLIDLLSAIGQASLRKSCDKSTPFITVASLTPVTVNSLRPTLQWNFNIDALIGSFENLQVDSADASKLKPINVPKHYSPADLSNLRYQVRIYRAEEIPSLHSGKKKELRAIKPTYEESGLIESNHVIEKDLEPCAHYLWTTRAIFELDGVTHSSEWAGNYWTAFKGNFDPAILRKALYNSRFSLMLGKPFDYAFPFSTPCENKPIEQSDIETKNNMSLFNRITSETKLEDSVQAAPRGKLPTSAGTTHPPHKVAASNFIEGNFHGKEIQKGGIAGLVKAIDIKLSFTNKTDKDISVINGTAKLLADDGGIEIGSLSFHLEKKIPSKGEIEIIHTVYPILFFGYSKLKEVSQEKIRAEFEFDTIEFSDGSKVTN